MIKPNTEIQRLAVLAELDLLDTAPEPAFDQLTELAKDMFDVPIALISLIDAERQWFKSCIGLDVSSTPREVAFCDFAIRDDTVMVVADAKIDGRFSKNALVLGKPFIRFYAGAPVHYRDTLIGTLCIIDRKLRPDFGKAEASRLEKLASAVSSILALRKDAQTNLAIMKERETTQKTMELVEDVAGVGQWSFDVKNGTASWSDQVFRIHGLPIGPKAPTYEALLSLYVEEDGRLLAGLVERAIETGEGYALEARIRRPDRSLRTVITKAVCFRGADGRVETLQGVFQDITDYREALDHAHHGEARYRLLAENMPGMLGYWDSDLLCRFANNAYLEWFNQSPESLVGVHIHTLLGDELYALNLPYIRGALAGEKQVFERAISKPNGDIGFTLAQYLPDIDGDRRVQGFYVLVTDITNQKLKEMALAESNAQLIQARQQAEAALEIKSQFLATMSHEIRTPLTTILGYANLLERHNDLSEDLDNFVKRIGKAGRTLLGLVNDVLDVSRLESREVTLSPQPVHVRGFVTDIVEQFQAKAQSQNLVLALRLSDDLPEWLLVDESRLSQVLCNLISNACKFTADGKVCISMDAVKGSSGERLRVEICDPGPGIAAANTEKLFKRFQQIDSGINRKHGGSGLGLAICSEIVKLMQGDIGVVSEVSTGSTFWFEIPLIRTSPDHLHQNPAPDAFLSTGVSDHQILIVDDHAINREMIRALISPVVGQISEASDGAEAIDLCRERKFDLVLMDLQMPLVDGVAATRAIRGSCPLNAKTPIVALTAMTKGRLPLGFSESLFDRVLTKPIDSRKLHAVLAALPLRDPVSQD